MASVVIGNENVLSIVRQALACVHSAVPDADSHRQAQNSLQQVKESLAPSVALELASALLAPLNCSTVLSQAEAPAIHFAFHVLEDCVLAPGPWDKVTDESRASLRRLAVELVPLVSTRRGEECFPSWTRQKVAALLAAIALREWPQYWPDLIESAIALGKQGAMKAVCEFFEILVVEVFEHGARIAKSRRSELSKALNLVLPQIVAFVKECAQICFEAGDVVGLTVVLGAVESLLGFCDFDTVVTSELASACIVMMKNPIARDSALAALATFSQRKIPQAGSHLALPNGPPAKVIRDRLFPELFGFISESLAAHLLVDSLLPVNPGLFPDVAVRQKSRPDSFNAEDHDFSVRLVEMMAAFGVSHFAVCFLPLRLTPVEPADSQQRSAAGFVEFMLAAVAHPSLRVRDAAMRFFAPIVTKLTSSVRSNGQGPSKKKPEVTHGQMEAARTTQGGLELVRILSIGFINAGTLGLLEYPDDDIAKVFFELDHDADVAERKFVAESVRARIITCLGFSSTLCSSRALPLTLDRLSDLLASVINASARDAGVCVQEQLPVKSLSDVVSVFPPGERFDECRWAFGPFTSGDMTILQACTAAVVSAAESVVAGSVSAGTFALVASENASLNCLASLFDMMAGISDPKLLSFKVQSFKMFVPVFRAYPERLTTALQILTSAVSSSSSIEVQQRACNSLASLVGRVAQVDGELLAGVRQQLCEFAAPRMIEAGRPMRQKTYLLEAATSCIMTLRTTEEMSMWLATLLNPLMGCLDPSNGWCATAFQSGGSFSSSKAFFHFFANPASCESRTTFATALCMIQTCTHQIARPQSRVKNGPLTFPTPLSSSVAPRCAELCSRFVPIVHGLYNEASFPEMKESAYSSALLPTCRELCSLAYEDSGYLNSVHMPHVDESGIIVDELELAREADVLARFGLVAPDPAHERVRDMLRFLRVGVYELLRNCILSGAVASAPHIGPVLAAISSDFQYLEPIHLYYLLNRVVRVLLSYPVVAASHISFVPALAESRLPQIIYRTIEQVEAIAASQILSSGNLTLDMSREQGRLRILRVACDIICGMFGSLERSSIVDSSFMEGKPLPAPLRTENELSRALWALFGTLCGVQVATVDKNVSRTVLDLLSRVCRSGPSEGEVQLTALLEPCLATCVFTYERGEEDYGAGTVADVVQRYPTHSRAWFQLVESTTAPGQTRVVHALDVLLSKTSNGWSQSKSSSRLEAVRDLIRAVAEIRGVSAGGSKNTIQVKSVPKPMPSVPTPRSVSRAQAEGEEEIILGDAALDSLFGSGEPL